MRGSALFLLFLLLLPPRVAAAAPAPVPALELGDTVEVREVVDGDTVVLADGRELRLVGIEAPALGLDPLATGRHRREWPLAREAKAALEDLLRGRVVALRYAGNRLDRHGRVLAHLFAGEVWVQGEMLRRGLARVYGFADNRAGIAEMLLRERQARRARRGIWRDPFYAVRRPEDAARFTGSFQLVEGMVVDAARIQGQVFLNFGPDWRTSFSLRIAGEALRLFRAEDIDLLALKGEKLRVRGWIHGTLRPIIEITHPEQIEELRG